MAPVDPDKLRHHIDHVRDRLRHLRRVAAEGRDSFLADEVSQAATVRWLHTAIEAVVDVGNHVISREGLGIPRSYAEVIEILVEHGYLPREQRERFLGMVRFRNRAVHLYDQIDAEEVFDIVAYHLGDFDLFLGALTDRYFEGSAP